MHRTQMLNATWMGLGRFCGFHVHCTSMHTTAMTSASGRLRFTRLISTKSELTDVVPVSPGSRTFRTDPRAAAATNEANRSGSLHCQLAKPDTSTPIPKAMYRPTCSRATRSRTIWDWFVAIWTAPQGFIVLLECRCPTRR